jgi:hypothetical protein
VGPPKKGWQGRARGEGLGWRSGERYPATRGSQCERGRKVEGALKVRRNQGAARSGPGNAGGRPGHGFSIGV